MSALAGNASLEKAHPAPGSITTTFFESIDILRGFAALSVVVYHVIEHFQWRGFPSIGPLAWFRVGWMGVDLFFVISGFVIGLSAFAGIDRSGTAGFQQPFMTRRLARIVPLHYLTMLVFVVFIAPYLLFHDFWLNALAHLLFVHNMHPQLHGAINGSNWSLGTEMQFYVLMLLLAPWLRTGRVLTIFLIFLGLSWAWRALMFYFIPISSSTGPFQLFFATTQLPGTLDEFAAGILLARLLRSPVAGFWIRDFRGRVAALIIACATCWLMWSIYWDHASYWDKAYMVIFWRSLLALAFAAILLVTISTPIKGLLRKILTPFYYLGTISYGIYLWHLPVLMPLKKLEWLEPWRALWITITITCLLASLSWYWIEKPLIGHFRGKRLTP